MVRYAVANTPYLAFGLSGFEVYSVSNNFTTINSSFVSFIYHRKFIYYLYILLYYLTLFT